MPSVRLWRGMHYGHHERHMRSRWYDLLHATQMLLEPSRTATHSYESPKSRVKPNIIQYPLAKHFVKARASMRQGRQWTAMLPLPQAPVEVDPSLCGARQPTGGRHSGGDTRGPRSELVWLALGLFTSESGHNERGRSTTRSFRQGE